MTSHRNCRWYDAYPRLAFAMQLLRLSPQQLRADALGELSDLLDEMTGPLQEACGFQTPAASQADAGGGAGPNNRWYDDPLDDEDALERLKAAPGRIKRVAAERLLHAIDRCA